MIMKWTDLERGDTLRVNELLKTKEADSAIYWGWDKSWWWTADLFVERIEIFDLNDSLTVHVRDRDKHHTSFYLDTRGRFRGVEFFELIKLVGD